MPYPRWLIKKMPAFSEASRTARAIKGLNTVCESAACPNKYECFGAGHLTFLILGSICTRNCAFCAVQHGTPATVDEQEAEEIVAAARELKLKYIVITSVTRDDLPDGGALHFARTVEALRSGINSPLEILIPDFGGNYESLERVVRAKPHVIGHNLETVKRLQVKIRPHAGYQRSLNLLSKIKEINDKIITKSGLMLGLGESDDEVLEAMWDLRETGCEILTLGQYRQPGREQIPVQRLILEEGFEYFRKKGLAMGYGRVFAGSYVRSSYRAAELIDLLR